MSAIPAVVEKHLDALSCWSDGRILLGSSNLTGRYWNGTLWCFPDASCAPNIENCITGIETDSGITDVLCIKQDRVVVSMDSGVLEIYVLENCTPTPVFTTLSYACEHDDIISSLSVTCDDSRIVSSGYDKCIKVWDLETYNSIATYRPVHAGIIYNVACSSTDPDVLLSCGEDGNIILLDLRLPKPATYIAKHEECSVPTVAAWQPQNNTAFAVGDDAGQIFIQDIRKSGKILKYQGHKRTVFRLAFSPHRSSWLASISDNSDVIVADIYENSTNTIYHDDRHSDFVRGLVWTPTNSLITCGWDKKVFSHYIDKSDSPMESLNV